MTSEILGMVGTREVSETRGSVAGSVIDTDYLTRFAQAHEAAGFDRVLIGYGASSPDGFAVASHVLHVTTKLKVLIAHRPGFVVPTLVARKLATLDHLTGGGRVGIHHITGGDERDQKRDGDYLDHDQRYARTGEFMEILRKTWDSTEPFDHTGEVYRFEGAFSSVKPALDSGIPLFFGGASPAAVAVGARHADVYMLWGEPREQIAERIAQVRDEAAKYDRTVSFSLSLRPIVAATEDAAWARAEEIRAATQARVDHPEGLLYGRRQGRQSSSVGAQRLQDQARAQEVYDERLWFGITALTGPGGNSTALVGTPEQVADSSQKYRDLGIDTFLIRGFDPLNDVVTWGERLVPLIRGQIADSESQLASAAS
jgi:alkanesulfonate monooxygenase